MQDFKCAIAKVDDIAVLQCLCLRASFDFVITGTETLVRNRLEVAVGNESELGSTQDHPLITAAQSLVLILMNEYLLEFVEIPAVIEMDVTGDDLEWLVE